MGQTRSEGIVSSSNKFYRSTGQADVKKNDARVRFIRKEGVTRALYAGSSGLDFSGVLRGGKYVSFELKETERDALPVSGIRETQLDTMEREWSMGCESFLLVLFTKVDEWYRLDWPDLKRVIDPGYGSIPSRYFRAFGMLVPSDKGFPEYLNPESYPTRNLLMSGYPSWMPQIRSRSVAVVPMQKIDNRDLDSRRNRISAAMERGMKSAERRTQMVEIFRSNNARSQRRDSEQD